jgi:hypothetical protein
MSVPTSIGEEYLGLVGTLLGMQRRRREAKIDALLQGFSIYTHRHGTDQRVPTVVNAPNALEKAHQVPTFAHSAHCDTSASLITSPSALP